MVEVEQNVELGQEVGREVENEVENEVELGQELELNLVRSGVAENDDSISSPVAVMANGMTRAMTGSDGGFGLQGQIQKQRQRPTQSAESLNSGNNSVLAQYWLSTNSVLTQY